MGTVPTTEQNANPTRHFDAFMASVDKDDMSFDSKVLTEDVVDHLKALSEQLDLPVHEIALFSLREGMVVLDQGIEQYGKPFVVQAFARGNPAHRARGD